MKKQFITTVISIGIMATGFTHTADAHELTYKVQPGDTLWKISTQNNISTPDLLKYNNLTSSTIYVGQELSLLAPHSHENTTQPTTYTVKSGDSLSLIARNHHTTVTELKAINNLSSDTIKTGQVLKIPNGKQTSSAPISQPPTSLMYTVQAGDTLWKIASYNGLSVSQLKMYNNLTTDSVYVGQVLRLKAAVETAPDVKVNSSFNVESLIAEGKNLIGVPYVWGGTTPSGFDCSGFLSYVFNKQGITIPRTVTLIWNAATPVSAPQKGDLVFFTTYATGPSHAGIYLGNNQFLHASTSAGVVISDMNNSYWKPRYLGAKSIK